MKEEFQDIDLFFAERALPNGNAEERHVLARLMAVSRQGHLCLHVDRPLESKWTHLDGNRLYLTRNWLFETKFLEQIKRLNERNYKVDWPVSEALEIKQQEAVKNALGHSLSLISGGPGTGKSYVAAYIAQLFLAHTEGRVVLAAPTGKAAAHLESKLPKDPRIRCGTLHTLLNIKSGADLNGEAGYLGADLLIVDECSMIDARMFGYLLASVERGTRVILMGDEDQLPAVDAGSFFADLITAVKKGYPLAWAHLDKCLRSERAEILELAASIRSGNAKDVDIGELRDDMFEGNFCILSCMRQGPFGVDALNKSIAEHFEKKTGKGQQLRVPIIITKNDYRHKLYNGQTGFLVRSIGQESEDYILIDGRTFSPFLIKGYEYAYVLSVHKSQGSEYDEVLLLIPPGSEVFGREVLYTAVTRARTKIEIRGSREIFNQALATSSRKLSGLCERLGL